MHVQYLHSTCTYMYAFAGKHVLLRYLMPALLQSSHRAHQRSDRTETLRSAAACKDVMVHMATAACTAHAGVKASSRITERLLLFEPLLHFATDRCATCMGPEARGCLNGHQDNIVSLSAVCGCQLSNCRCAGLTVAWSSLQLGGSP